MSGRIVAEHDRARGQVVITISEAWLAGAPRSAFIDLARQLAPGMVLIEGDKIASVRDALRGVGRYFDDEDHWCCDAPALSLSIDEAMAALTAALGGNDGNT